MQFIVMISNYRGFRSPHNFVNDLDGRDEVEMTTLTNDPYDIVVIMQAASRDGVTKFFNDIESRMDITILDVLYNPSAPTLITTDDIPGYVRSPVMRPAVVHSDFSSQAGMASFAGIGGLNHLAALGD